MNKKGFTLIEMIAVLVIISLIALISVTAVTKLLDSSKKTLLGTQKTQIESAARMWASDNLLILPNSNTSSDVCNYNDYDNCPEDYKKLIIDLDLLQRNGYIGNDIKNPQTNQSITDATIEIEKSGKKLKYTVNINETSKYVETILNGAYPKLEEDMVAVTISNNGKVKKADLEKEWYKYEDKKWANAVVLKTSSTYEVGEQIPENNIKAYYVWIPRFKYQLFSSSLEEEIQVIFESNYTSKSNSTTIGQFLTHPAFTSNTEELNGFWVGKFEPTMKATETADDASPTIKPYMSSNLNSELVSLRGQNVSSQYAKALTISNHSRMMKNDEWGAVAYLSHSQYGINKQIRINNNKNYRTGCGASEDNKEESTSCDIEYGTVSNYPQSTTGNITGVFDMAGGAWEYTMGILVDSDGNPYSGRSNTYHSGFNGKYSCPTCDSNNILEFTTGTSFPDAKNYSAFGSSTISTACNDGICYGHALSETIKGNGENNGWYNDYSIFVSTESPWIRRGGRCADGSYAGIFAYSNANGNSSSAYSYRVVVKN